MRVGMRTYQGTEEDYNTLHSYCLQLQPQFHYDSTSDSTLKVLMKVDAREVHIFNLYTTLISGKWKGGGRGRQTASHIHTSATFTTTTSNIKLSTVTTTTSSSSHHLSHLHHQFHHHCNPPPKLELCDSYSQNVWKEMAVKAATEPTSLAVPRRCLLWKCVSLGPREENVAAEGHE